MQLIFSIDEFRNVRNLEAKFINERCKTAPRKSGSKRRSLFLPKMRPIIMLPESKNTAKPPSWRQCLEKYQQNKAKGDTLLDSKPAQKPDRKTTRRSRIQSKRSDGTELASKMTGKPDSQEKALTNSLVTITIKPRWNENGDTGYSCEVTSDKVTKLGEAQSAVEVDTAEEQMPVESGSKRLSVDASLEKLRREMVGLISCFFKCFSGVFYFCFKSFVNNLKQIKKQKFCFVRHASKVTRVASFLCNGLQVRVRV